MTKCLRWRCPRLKKDDGCKWTRCTSEGPMRHGLPPTPDAVGVHDVSIRATPLRDAFGTASTIAISLPHAEQIGCHLPSLADAAVASVGVTAAASPWVTYMTCCCAVGGSSRRMRASLVCRLPLARKP